MDCPSCNLLLLTGHPITEEGYLSGFMLASKLFVYANCNLYLAVWREDETTGNFQRVTNPIRIDMVNQLLDTPFQFVANSTVLIKEGDVIGVYHNNSKRCLSWLLKQDPDYSPGKFHTFQHIVPPSNALKSLDESEPKPASNLWIERSNLRFQIAPAVLPNKYLDIFTKPHPEELNKAALTATGAGINVYVIIKGDAFNLKYIIIITENQCW